MRRVIERFLKLAGVCLLGVVAGTVTGQAQDTPDTQTPSAISSRKLAQASPVTYDNRYEVYGGINLENFQAGQNLPKRMNLGGVELAGTYWFTGKLGAMADVRGEAGTTPVFPNPYTTRPLVVLYNFLGGVQYRGPKNRLLAIDYHALAGGSYGDFTETPIPAGYSVGLYNNHVAPKFAVGGSLDVNRTKNLAIRLQPDLILEHFGTETREFFSISGGIVYRLGKR